MIVNDGAHEYLNALLLSTCFRRCLCGSTLTHSFRGAFARGRFAFAGFARFPIWARILNPFMEVFDVAHLVIIKGSLEAKLPTLWADERQGWEGKRREEKRKRRERERERGRGRGRGREEKRRRKKEREEKKKVRRNKVQVREKVGKSRNIVCFQWFVAPKGRKVGSLKRRVRSHVVRWEMKVIKLHAVVAWSTFPSQNAQNTPTSDHFWKLEVVISKKCTLLWREAHLEVKCTKHLSFGASEHV